jgi:hypothetical protein
MEGKTLKKLLSETGIPHKQIESVSGVSLKTIDSFLNERGNIKDETRKIIDAAIWKSVLDKRYHDAASREDALHTEYKRIYADWPVEGRFDLVENLRSLERIRKCR